MKRARLVQLCILFAACVLAGSTVPAKSRSMTYLLFCPDENNCYMAWFLQEDVVEVVAQAGRLDIGAGGAWGVRAGACEACELEFPQFEAPAPEPVPGP